MWHVEKTPTNPVFVLDVVLWHFGVALDTY